VELFLRPNRRRNTQVNGSKAHGLFFSALATEVDFLTVNALLKSKVNFSEVTLPLPWAVLSTGFLFVFVLPKKRLSTGLTGRARSTAQARIRIKHKPYTLV
jgi:hypothetical protein